MASGIFAILDDITALMDDVALATKVATRKTAGILGDDLAVNAEKATGFLADRELPILWAITKGSLLNKLIIVPIALLLNVFVPVAITVVLLLGGCYLAYEGVEKIIEYVGKKKTGKHSDTSSRQTNSDTGDEKAKIKAAITTDFILSVEIVIIALGAVEGQETPTQIVTVSVVAVLATVGVYGLVALLVRMDDAGYRLIKQSGDKGFFSRLGHGLVAALPLIIRLLSVVGTVALLLVAGGLFVHNIHYLHTLFPELPSFVKELGIGLLVGLVIAGLLALFRAIGGQPKPSAS